MKLDLRNQRAPAAGAALFLLLGLAPQGLAATHPDPANDGGITCTVSGDEVNLSWNVVFIAPIRAWVVHRDGQAIAQLEPEAMGYLDIDVPEGEHTYDVVAENLDGSIGFLGSCSVVVGDFGIECGVLADGAVLISWQLLIDIAVSGFTITRNGEPIASLPADAHQFQDTSPSPGLNRYVVLAETQAGIFFVVGACSVREGTGLICIVEGSDVHLDWSRIPLPLRPWDHFVVLRNGVLIAETRETSYKDSPGPGEHLYEVGLDDANFLLGSCSVTVAGEGPPAPEDLACAVAMPEPLPGAGGIVPGALVSLSWKNPVPYDFIAIARNGMPIARLPGNTESFSDHPPSFQHRLVYEVRGIVGNTPSGPAVCQVVVGPPILPPPAEFQCRLDDMTLDPAIGAPVPVVLLTWVNLVEYAELVLGRDGVEIARLPGDAMSHRDLSPPPGTNMYSIFGVGPDGIASDQAFCTLETSGGPPAVRNLQCFAANGTAMLAWENPIRYDKILVQRTNDQAPATLPGDATRFEEANLPPGIHFYAVIGVVDDRSSAPRTCRVLVEGLPPDDLLFFSTSLAMPVPLGGINDPAGSGQVTCLARNSAEMQGWSFGVKSDPAFLVPVELDLEGTATANLNDGSGPTFLSVNVSPEGVTMAAIVDEEDPDDTLPPPDFAHALANIRYGAGPGAVAGDLYPVEYSDGLGDPPVAVLFVVKGFEVRPARLGGFVALVPEDAKYLRGDSNGDGIFDISDPVHTLGYLFLGDGAPPCLEAADSNASRELNIADAVYSLQHLFGENGPPPPPPFPECGLGAVALGCGMPGC